MDRLTLCFSPIQRSITESSTGQESTESNAANGHSPEASVARGVVSLFQADTTTLASD